MGLQELAFAEMQESRFGLAEVMHEEERDRHDIEIARTRLREIRENPNAIISGAELDERLSQLLQ